MIDTLLIDLGTTTVAMALFDGASGEMHTTTFANPQRSLGEDVISRMTAVSEGHADELRTLICDALAGEFSALCEKVGVAADDLKIVYIGGNATMIALFSGAKAFSNTASLDISALPSRMTISLADFRTVSPLDGASASYSTVVDTKTIPAVSEFIGGDIVAGMRAVDMSAYDICLFIDLGTNGEMVLSRDGKLFGTATAAGPAFEGGKLSCGCPGISGGITAVRLGRIQHSLTTIDNIYPIGLCGCGAVSLVAELLKGSYVNPDTTLSEKFPAEGIVLGQNSSSKIIFTADDLHEVLLAKAAIAAGIDTLCKAAQITPADVEHVYLAGGLGYFLDPESCETVGLFSDIPRERVEAMGNTCLQGLANIACMDFKTKSDILKNSTSISEKPSSSSHLPDSPDMHVINLGMSGYFKKKFIEKLEF